MSYPRKRNISPDLYYDHHRRLSPHKPEKYTQLPDPDTTSDHGNPYRPQDDLRDPHKLKRHISRDHLAHRPAMPNRQPEPRLTNSHGHRGREHDRGAYSPDSKRKRSRRADFEDDCRPSLKSRRSRSTDFYRNSSPPRHRSQPTRNRSAPTKHYRQPEARIKDSHGHRGRQHDRGDYSPGSGRKHSGCANFEDDYRPSLTSRRSRSTNFYRNRSPTRYKSQSTRHSSAPANAGSGKARQPSRSGHPAWQAVARTALQAGAAAAYKMRHNPGPWMGEKGTRVASAAISTALVDSFINRKYPKKQSGI